MSVQSALSAITATYTDSEDDVEDELQEMSNTPRGAAPHYPQVGQPRILDSPISGRSTSNSPVISSNSGKRLYNSYNAPTLVTAVTSRVTRLVSYNDDTVVSDDEGDVSVETEEQPTENGRLPSATNEQSPSRQDELVSDGEADDYGVTIPPEPVGVCPPEMQSRITALYTKMESGGLDMNKVIQQRKDFRNPSIYEKLIQYCEIDELGSNFPPERFDPTKWGKDSYYEELAKIQKVEMDRLETKRKEKGTKIEIVSGLAKRPNPSSTTADEDAKRRKSKWDQVATGAAPKINRQTNPSSTTADDDAKIRKSKWDQVATGAAPKVSKPSLLFHQPTSTTLTSSATGTKAIVISAFGSLLRKRL